MRNDDFTLPTKRLIAARSGFACAYPNCFAPTSGPAEDGSSVSIGEAAHITAAQPNGPRFDPSLSEEQRRDAENGIWMCRTHAALIDRDVARFTTDLLRDWKYEAEDRAMRMLGQPRGCASGRLASSSQAVRLGANACVIVDGQNIPHTYIIDPNAVDSRLTWFVSALVVQFAIEKKHTLKHAVIDHFTAIVHETRPIPKYQRLMQAFPAEASLYYIDLDVPAGMQRREFRPNRYFVKAHEGAPEAEQFPPTMVLNDDTPAQIAVRFNAKTPAMYLVELEATVSAGSDREVLSVMPPQWMIFEHPMDDYNPDLGA